MQTTDNRAEDKPLTGNAPQGNPPTGGADGQMACHRGKGVKGMLGMAACCGAPIAAGLLLVFFGGYLGSVGTAAGAALPYLALLACPLGMYFMMRFMMRPEPPPSPQVPPALPQPPVEKVQPVLVASAEVASLPEPFEPSASLHPEGDGSDRQAEERSQAQEVSSQTT